MMNKIKQLDVLVANMIAAGEVVDRPAAVVKELIENSIDASSTKIICEIKDIGIKEIKVTDNGLGISKEELPIAIERHATSKVSSASDLNKISTLGFRGEALASIASVSKLKIASRVEGSEGYFVYYEKNELKNDGSVALNVGTEVTVSDLFYQTPARFKYLKSEYTERNQIIATFDALALANPHISFELIIDNKQVRKTFGNNNILQNIDNIIGQTISKNLIEFSHKMNHINIKGYISKPNLNRSNRKDMYLFINNRVINNFVIQKAIIDGYQTLLMKNRYPVCVLFIEIDPSLVDVNIHPQKHQVRLANESQLAFQLSSEITKTLLSRENSSIENIQTLKAETINLNFGEELIDDTLTLFDNINTTEVVSYDPLPAFNYVGQVKNTYLMFNNEKGIYFIDQHAADERIRFEYYHSISADNITSRPLLISYELNLSKADIMLIDESSALFNKLGFEINNGEVYQHPDWLRINELDLAVESIVNKINNEEEVKVSALKLQLSKDISCKAAIKANHRLTKDEVDHLISNLRKCENPYSCPHGRPIMVFISYYEIEKWFKRVV